MRKHRRNVARLVYWANEGTAWSDLAKRAGYEIDWFHRDEHTEAGLVSNDRVVASMRRLKDGEWFGFVWVNEARTPCWRDAFWRLTHPRTPRYARKIGSLGA